MVDDRCQIGRALAITFHRDEENERREDDKDDALLRDRERENLAQPSSLRRVTDWIFEARFGEALQPQLTRIAAAACSAVGTRIVAAVREREVNAKLHSFPHDVSLREFDQRRMNLKTLAAIARLRADRRQPLKRFEERRPAIRVAAVINRIDAEKNVGGTQRPPPRQVRMKEKSCSARGRT